MSCLALIGNQYQANTLCTHPVVVTVMKAFPRWFTTYCRRLFKVWMQLRYGVCVCLMVFKFWPLVYVS